MHDSKVRFTNNQSKRRLHGKGKTASLSSQHNCWRSLAQTPVESIVQKEQITQKQALGYKLGKQICYAIWRNDHRRRTKR